MLLGNSDSKYYQNADMTKYNRPYQTAGDVIFLIKVSCVTKHHC